MIRNKTLFFVIAFLGLAISACGSAKVSVSSASTRAHTLESIPTNPPAPTISPTATSQPLPITRSQVEAVLISHGFVHRPDLDGVDTCRVEGCKVYESISDGINAWTYPDGSLYLIINYGGQNNATKQETTLALIITPLYGGSVNAWIFVHLPAAASGNQEGSVSGYNITIGSVDAFGSKLIMIVIVPKS